MKKIKVFVLFAGVFAAVIFGAVKFGSSIKLDDYHFMAKDQATGDYLNITFLPAFDNCTPEIGQSVKIYKIESVTRGWLIETAEQQLDQIREGDARLNILERRTVEVKSLPCKI